MPDEGPHRRSRWGSFAIKERASRERVDPAAVGVRRPRDCASLEGAPGDIFALYIKTKSFQWHMSGPHFRDHTLLHKGLKRLGSADEIAGAALFLASEDSAFMPGAEILLDGGLRDS